MSGIEASGIQIKEFISDMALAYSAADVIVSRAGAIAISELAVAEKPVLLVPFPFAAEDHQTKNALTLVEKNAARMVKDSEMKDKFWSTLSEICENENLRKEMSNLEFFAKPKAAEGIVDEIFKVISLMKLLKTNYYLFILISTLFSAQKFDSKMIGCWKTKPAS
jgi:UDP-N-acetylglucosamine--N-acetylmuramyl-(pentapeptide) pyrophosphoryl-undecaprenol N-acetylglucosamine transferase